MRHPVFPLPSTSERYISRVPGVHRVQFTVGDDSGRRYGADPTRRPLPGPDGRGVVDADGLVILNNSSTTFTGLPFERIARQTFIRGSLPGVSPKIPFSFASFASLDAGRHGFQFVPGPWRHREAVQVQQVGSVLQDADVRVVRSG